MERLSDDLQIYIYSYIRYGTCGFQLRYIVNKFTREYYLNNYKICYPIHIHGHSSKLRICYVCNNPSFLDTLTLCQIFYSEREKYKD
jgi:hypothetical protein